jgi:hypothetical protein
MRAHLQLIAVGAAFAVIATAAAAQAPAVTVTAKPPPASVNHAAYAFVQSITVQPDGESLARWNEPICPLVEGLTDEQDVAVATRIDQIALAAGADVGGDGCAANFLVIASREPGPLLAAWRRRDPLMFDGASTSDADGFVSKARPVRVWYNVHRAPAGGQAVTTDAGTFQGIPSVHVATISRLKRVTVRGIDSVILVVDTGQARDVTVEQIADYVAVAGLAEIKPDADLDGVPTILRLFSATSRPVGLTDWDRGFLAGLYRSDQASPLQRSAIAADVTAAATQPRGAFR